MGTVYVISTMSNDNVYCVYEDRKDVKVVKKEIKIYGGSNIQNRRTLQVSSKGVTTPISEEDFADLEKIPLFDFHRKKGFITVVKSNESDARKKAEKVNLKDKSAQFTRQDYKDRGFKKVPTANIDEIEAGQ